MKPSADTVEILKFIKTELTAGMALVPKDDLERTWNNAHERALSIVQNYAEGNGLFQMTRKAGKR